MKKYPVKHHYVPRFYLTGFTNESKEESKLYVFDTEKMDLRTSTPINEGFENHLYRLDTRPTDEGDILDVFEIEKGFGNFEDVVSPILKKVRDTFELPEGEDLDILINFIALQSVRTPYHINNFDKPIQDISKMSMKMMLSTKERWESVVNRVKKEKPDFNPKLGYESMKKFVDKGNYDVIVARNYKLSMMLSSIDIMISLLGQRQWSLWIASDLMSHFICSDDPVTITWTNGLSAAGLQKVPGFGMNNTNVIMPISKNIAIIGKFEINTGAICSAHAVANINTRTMMFAKRYLYSNMESFIYINKNQQLDNSSNFLKELRQS